MKPKPLVLTLAIRLHLLVHQVSLMRMKKSKQTPIAVHLKG